MDPSLAERNDPSTLLQAAPPANLLTHTHKSPCRNSRATENQVDLTAPKMTNLTVITSNQSELDEIPGKNVKRMVIIKAK